MTTGAFKEGSNFGLQLKGIQSVMAGKGCCQEKGAAGHIVSIVRKQIALNAGTQLIFSFSLGQGTQSME